MKLLRIFILSVVVLVLVVTFGYANASTGWNQYLHNVTRYSRNLYREGIRQGNQTGVFAKVGDSITAEHFYLYPVGEGHSVLGEYSHFSEIIAFYPTSYHRESVSAIGGITSYGLLDPNWNLPVECLPEENAVECEYRLVNPSIAIIMAGTNDAGTGVPVDDFEGRLERIVQITVERKIVPILSTIPPHQFVDVTPFNDAVIEVALRNRVPYMDYYGAMINLPNQGVREDGVHPSYPPHGNTASFVEGDLQYGYNVRNVLTLYVLDYLYRYYGGVRIFTR